MVRSGWEYFVKGAEMKTTIGLLKVGQYFMLDGRKYRVGHLISGTNSYVACTDITDDNRKVKRFYIDTEVEKLEQLRGEK